MKVIFGFNAIHQDGMGTAATTLMRALKKQNVDVVPVHAWHDIDLPGYEEEFHPIFVKESKEEPLVEEVIEKMVSVVNNDTECNIFSHFGSPNWACVIPFLRKDIRVVVSVHSVTPSALKIALAYRQRVSSYIPVSWEVEKKLRKHLSAQEQSKVHRIVNVVDVNLFMPKSTYISNGPIKLVFLGRVEDVTKGCDKIPAIAKILKERGLDFQWSVYGYFHWGYESRFYQLNKDYDVEDVVVYKGCLNPNEIPSMLCQQDIMIMPSNHEGCPLALLEAMASGLPCVASKLQDVTDVIIDKKKDGELCEKNDVKEFAEKIYELAVNLYLRENMGRAARKKVETNFSLESQGVGYKYVFNTVMTSMDYKMVKAPSLKDYKQPEMVKPHILARILPLWFKKILKKFI